MQNFSLADPDFDKPGEIDIILGNGVFWNIITEGSHKLGNGKPILQNTKFGWVLAGPLLLHSSAQYKSKCYKVNESSQDVQQQLARFWEIEELPNVKLLSEEERQTELHFTNTFERSSDGRFIVSIPFKKSINLLGNSQAGALQRFLNLERKLLSHPELKVKYASFMREYEQLKHMTKIEDNATESVEYYLPHHCVINEASKTTRLRVVFDASFLSSSGYSLNNLQCVGPVIQNDLISILLKFRQHLVVMSADISKMYRQVLIKTEERSLQKIFWRYEPTDNISTYTLNTVTYGTASASFLAVRCLHQLAIENSNKYPKAYNIILNSFYVDDLLFGTDELEEASVLCKQISEILDQGCFPLRKWLSNYSQILNDLENLAEENMTLPLGDSEMSKTLGLFWVAKKDVLTFNVSLQIPYIITKRNILSLISQIFDPLGLLGPCIISIKILLQLIWLEKLNWDDTIPDNIQKSWLNFHKKLPILNQITIPRHVICNKPISIELHGFSDASEKAYGASIYIRSESIDGLIISRLLCAKAKVAPIKSLTIPRLELQAALLLAKLMHKVITSLTLNLNQINLWCDSSIVLSWLQTEPNTL